MHSASVGIRELKAKLSAYMRRVKEGERIAISERGKVVGFLVPASRSLDVRLKEVIDSGAACWSGKKIEPGKPVARSRAGRSVASILVEDRK